MPIFEFNKPETFQPAIDKAWEELIPLDPKIVVERANVSYDENLKKYTIPVLGEEYAVSLNDQIIQPPGEEADEHIFGAMSVLALHYLINAKSTTLRNKLVSYRELPDGIVFYNAFRSIAIQPIAQEFGEALDTFEERAGALEGRKIKLGEVAFEFKIFPRVPVTYILWGGDEEIAASANILFDESASEHLHTEDLAEVGEVITHQLIH
ncbi:DUF3786 domain-containing protein [[Eubacterium] cellulosolvens]